MRHESAWKFAVAWMLSVFVSASGFLPAWASGPGPKGVYAQVAVGRDGQPMALSAYAGKVALIVNTASRCGFTGQYEGLQRLQSKYRDKGFVVLGFPSNDFFGQEPGSNQEIKLFCQKNYKVDFPLFNKDHVKGEGKQAVYKYLTDGPQSEFKGEISWNFEKFLVGRDGKILARFSPRTSPEDLELVAKLETALAAK
jgi:glutathione peroxidase